MSRAATTAGHAANSIGRRSHMLSWLMGFGGMGLFVVSAIDASMIPLPLPGSTDVLLLLLVIHGANPWVMALIASAGSLVGGYLCWGTGRKGGEAALHRYASAKTVDRVNGWIQSHGLVAVVGAALLPPPFPLTPFVLAAGALGVDRRRFLLSFGFARSGRYLFLAWIGAIYGRRALHLWNRYLARWSGTIVWTLVGLLAGGVLFGIWKFRRRKRRDSPSQTPSLYAGK